MTYQILRDGQTYGPYTLEDLQRYVASGNVLLTDVAKSEEMTEWVSVSLILNASAPAPGYAAPPAYAAASPAYAGAPVGTAYPDPPNLNWGLELLLGFFTFGLFVVVWNLVLAAWAKRVEPASQALMFYIIATVLIVMNVGSSWGMMIALSHHQQPPHQGLFGGIVSIGGWVIRLIARFSLRETLERHFNGPEPLGLQVSAVLTFFFGGIYLQYKLNEMNRMKEAIRLRSSMR